jgi:hypothetical protein
MSPSCFVTGIGTLLFSPYKRQGQLVLPASPSPLHSPIVLLATLICNYHGLCMPSFNFHKTHSGTVGQNGGTDSVHVTWSPTVFVWALFLTLLISFQFWVRVSLRRCRSPTTNLRPLQQAVECVSSNEGSPQHSPVTKQFPIWATKNCQKYHCHNHKSDICSKVHGQGKTYLCRMVPLT